jgi:hypothetical protein
MQWNMRTLTASQVLDVWESAIHFAAPRRAVALLAAACPERAVDELLALPLGQRNQMLLRLREYLFGPTLTMTASCPACGVRLESSLQLANLQTPIVPGECRHTLSLGDREIAFHAPRAGDLIDLPADAVQARDALLSRCLVDVDSRAGVGISADALSSSDIAAVVDAMAVADPQANVDIGLICEACAHRWDCAFDIVTFLWHEIDAWAQRTLREVHLLAHAYCWSEHDILAMSPTRRQVYLEWSRA